MSASSEESYTGRLPALSLRDRINVARQNAKFKWVPFRGYYRYRAHKYLRRIDSEMGLLRFLMSPAVVSLDVGANVGLFTYYLARYSRHVHAFEPNPLACDVLQSVADRNVTVHRTALTDRAGEVELYVPRNRKGWSSNGGSLQQMRWGDFGRVRVPGRRIDDLGLSDIGFIKIDVEGHELAVLRGAQETLRRDRPNLFVENEHSHAGGDAAAVFDLLKELDYEGFFLDGGVLTSLTRFSPEEHQLSRRNTPGTRQSYVKNFIFLPRDAAGS